MYFPLISHMFHYVLFPLFSHIFPVFSLISPYVRTILPICFPDVPTMFPLFPSIFSHLFASSDVFRPFPTSCPTCPHQNSLISPVLSHYVPTILLMKFPVFSHSFPMNFPYVSHSFPSISPMFPPAKAHQKPGSR